MKYYGITMVVCPACRHEHAGPLKTCPVCRDRIATWKQKHQGKDRLHKREYAAKKRGADDYDELFYSTRGQQDKLSLIHISEPTRLLSISYAVFCLKKKK